MRKIGTLLTSLFTAAGFVFAVLRLIFLNNNIDTNGLPDHSAVSLVINALPALAVIVCFITAWAISSKKMMDPDIPLYHTERKDILFLILHIAAAVLIIIHGIISYPTAPEIMKHHNTLGTPLAVICALVLTVNAICIYIGKNSKIVSYLHIFAPLYLCLQLGEIFTANLSNPSLPFYSFECISLGAAALFLISQAGCSLKKDQVSSSIFTGLMALLFAPAAFIAPVEERSTIIYLAVILFVLPELMDIFPCLVKRVKKDNSKDKAETAPETD